MNTKTTSIKTKEEFSKFSSDFQQSNIMPVAYGIGHCYTDSQGNTIAVKWLTVNVLRNLGTAAAILECFDVDLNETPIWYKEVPKYEVNKLLLEKYFAPFIDDQERNHINVKALTLLPDSRKACFIVYAHENLLKEKTIESIADAHFRLTAISRLEYKPNELCLDKIFSVLPNLVWVNNVSVMTVEEWNRNFLWHNNTGSVVIDKIPLLTWGAPIPEGVRMPNQYSARLGAYLSPGTTIMHYGFVNTNAGTLGNAMVEGTIAYGVTIGDGTDIGKGAGFLGTLSGGNTVKISAGKNCLIGALAECGIPLGDNCVVGAGVVFTENTPFYEVFIEDKKEIRSARTKKAKEFSGISNLTFRRNSLDGCLEVLPRDNKALLNEALHETTVASVVID